jgi:hypothetical protein
LARLTGPGLNRRYGIKAKTGRYRETGDWFGKIEEFPATLWDGPPFRYVLFNTEAALKKCPGLTVHPSGQITARRDHRHYKSSRKFHIRQTLTLPERTPQFTVMRAAWSSTIERVNLDRFLHSLVRSSNLAATGPRLCRTSGFARCARSSPARHFAGTGEPIPGVDRSGRRSWGVDNAVGLEQPGRHWQRRAHPTTPQAGARVVRERSI